jgi:CRP/FNR family transcriptional regulator, cyclic AMP receptor protein
MSVEQTLANVELFSEMPQKDLSRLARLAVTKQYQAGDTIVKEGELGVAFYVISKGTVEIVKGMGTEGEVVLAKSGPGETGFFGEMALFADNQPRSASVRAATDCEFHVITKWDFNAELNSPGSKIAIAMLPILAKRVRALNSEGHTH